MKNIITITLVTMSFFSCSEKEESTNLPSTPAYVPKIEKSIALKEKVLPSSTSHEAGMKVYLNECKDCHQANGTGYPDIYPPLAKSDFIFDKQATIKQVLNGSSGGIVVNGKPYNGTMQSFSKLSDQEIADLLSFVYKSWGNTPIEVTPEEVSALR
jgi:mono/diheme cytochrome c family protein